MPDINTDCVHQFAYAIDRATLYARQCTYHQQGQLHHCETASDVKLETTHRQFTILLVLQCKMVVDTSGIRRPVRMQPSFKTRSSVEETRRDLVRVKTETMGPSMRLSHVAREIASAMSNDPLTPSKSLHRLTQVTPTSLGEKNGRGLDYNGLIEGYWKSGLCDCMHDWHPNWLMSTFCPCIALGQTTHRIGLWRFHYVAALYGALTIAMYSCVAAALSHRCSYALLASTQMNWIAAHSELTLEETVRAALFVVDARDSSTKDGVMCLLASIACLLCLVLVLWYIRASIREIFKIPGSCAEDMLFSLCCASCAIAQLATHTHAYKRNVWSMKPRDILPGYVLSNGHSQVHPIQQTTPTK